jgi:hypothetical protein
MVEIVGIAIEPGRRARIAPAKAHRYKGGVPELQMAEFSPFTRLATVPK